MPLLLLNARLKALNHCRGILTRRSDAGECYMKRVAITIYPRAKKTEKGEEELWMVITTCRYL